MHYRWQCKAQRTNWLANDLTCSHCRCYVCNIALSACGVNSHKWAAPTAILNWESKRPIQQAWTPLNEGAYELFQVQVQVVNVNNGQMLASTGLLTPAVTAYMSKPVPGNMWTFIKDSMHVLSPDRIQHISSRETINPLTYMGHNSYMNVSQIRGNIYHTIQWQVEQKRLHVIAYIRATMWSFVVSFRFPALGYGPAVPPSTLPDLSAFPRPLFYHQIQSLQDMMTIEQQSLHVRLWRKLHIPEVFAQNMTPDIDLDSYKRAFYVRQPGCVLPDSMIRGGLLQNDRGTGKTYIVATLIWMNRAHDISHDLKLCSAVSVDNEDDDQVTETTVPVITAVDDTGLVPVLQTLVVVPAANLIPQWVQELQMLDLKVIVHHGRTRVGEIADLADYDVVITTTDTLRCAWNSTDSVFRKVKFWRVVFDECHKLLQGSSFTKAGIACVELHAVHRWGLTATPDVTYSRSRLFAQLIAGPTTLQLAENSIMHRFIQFPGRYSSQEGMHWPIYNSMVVLHDPGNNVLPAVHRNTYRIVLENMPAYNEAVARVRQIGTRRGGMYLMRVFNNMLATINGTGPMRWPDYTASELGGGELVEVPPDMYDCSICLDMMLRPVRSACNHFFCSNCIQHWLRTAPGCPLCRQPALPMMTCAEISHGSDEEDLSLLPSSAKAAFLVSRIESLLTTTDANNEPNRILVFSRYLHMRNLLQTMLGSDAATSDINVFREQQKAVLIMSYVSGSVGLNLMEANHVILCEPCFRTSTEEQAIGRAARMGQRRVVNVHQVVMAETIEEIMLGVERDAKLSIQTVFGI